MSTRFFLIGFAAILAACNGKANEPAHALPNAGSVQAPSGAPAAVASADTVVASWDGGQVTYADLEVAAKGKLIALDVEYLTNRHQTLTSALNGILEERLLEAEATARSITVEQLLKEEIEAKLDTPSDRELKAFYEGNIRRFKGKSFDEVKENLSSYLARQQQGERYTAFMAALQQKANAAINLARPELPRFDIGSDDDPVRGAPDAAVTIVEFADYQCGYCERALPTLNKLLVDYEGQVRWVFRDFPLSFHQRAVPASVAANCAGEQDKYWEMHDVLMTNQRKLEDDHLRGYAKKLGLNLEAFEICQGKESHVAEIMADMADAQTAGVTGTPAFFVNGVLLSGAQPYEAFKEVIDAELAKQEG